MTSKSAPPADYAGVPLPEVMIITNRLLSADTTENVLNALESVPNIRQINPQDHQPRARQGTSQQPL